MKLPLGGDDFPASAVELEKALRDGLASSGAADLRVEISGEFPLLRRIALDLSGASVPVSIPRCDGGSAGHLDAEELKISARPLRYEEAGLSLEIHARDVRMEFQRSETNQPFLITKSAREGSMALTIERAELEKLVRSLAARAARSQGVEIERTNLQLTAAGSKALDFVAEIVAQKMFLKTSIRLSGHLEVDDQLNAKLSKMTCSGEGMFGGLACNFLQTQLARFEAKSFPLAFDAMQITDVSLDAGEPLCLTAGFGATG